MSSKLSDRAAAEIAKALGTLLNMPSDIEAPLTDLATRLQDLLASLDAFGADAPLPSALVHVFNDLLRQVRSCHGAAAVPGVDPLPTGPEYSSVDCQEVSSKVEDLIAVVGGRSGPVDRDGGA